MSGLDGQSLAGLHGSVIQTFENALASSDLVFSETQLVTLKTASGVSFQCRYCPVLSKKPSKGTDRAEKTGKQFDPFEDPAPGLSVCSIRAQQDQNSLIIEICDRGRSTHNIVLNKYPVIRNHFIVATTRNEPQTHPLNSVDLGAVYSCIRAWPLSFPEQRLFAFFNSGDQSGASQAHRHIQLLPVKDMQSGPADEWQVLCDSMTTPCADDTFLHWNPKLPFVHFAARLAPTTTLEELHEAYVSLLTATYRAVSLPMQVFALDTAINLSYNLAITDRTMAIMPRRAETTSTRVPLKSHVSINGTVLAGTMMTKDEEVFTELQRAPALLDEILFDIGVPADPSISNMTSKF